MTLPGIVMLIVKIVVLLGLGVYGVFAGVIVRQEQLMAHVLEERFEPTLKLLAIIHFIAAILLFGFALIIL